MYRWGVMLAVLLSLGSARAQWETQRSGTAVRLRGLDAVDAQVAWASGDRGTWARTTDGGRTWQAGTVPGAEALDFRDVEAFGPDTAYLLSSGEGERSRIYKTTDGGKHWTLQFTSRTPGAFFNGMAFWDAQQGIAFSDPVDGRFLLIRTSDGGRHWEPLPPEALPPALEGEAGFAASGTGIVVGGTGHVWFGTGGSAARVFHSPDRGRTWSVARTPLASGDGAGVFSLVFWSAREGVVVGGNYRRPEEAAGTIALTRDGGRTWTPAPGPGPRGYRSCVAHVPDSRGPTLVAVGPTGADVSTDGGRSWKPLGDGGFHSIRLVGLQGEGWAAGEEGRVARLVALSPAVPPVVPHER